MIGVSILGSGAYAEVHGQVVQNDPRAELLSVWSPTPANRERFAKQFSTRAADDWRHCIEDPNVTAVHVATPDFAHTDYVIAALQAGKHVLVEKPMATSVDECHQIIKARDASGKKLMVNYHNRWYPGFAKAREMVASGAIGTPVSANFVLSDTITWVETSMKWADRTGPEWFLMTHITDLASWVLSDTPEEVFAMAREGLLRSKGMETRDLVKCMSRMKNGAVVQLETSWILSRAWRNPVNEMWISIQGETGRVDVNADFENVIAVTETYQTPFTLLDSTEVPPIQDFITCLIEDTPVPVTAEEGLLATEWVEAVVASYTKGQSVRLA